MLKAPGARLASALLLAIILLGCNTIPVDWPYGWSHPLDLGSVRGSLVPHRGLEGFTVSGITPDGLLFTQGVKESGAGPRTLYSLNRPVQRPTHLQALGEPAGSTHLVWEERSMEATEVRLAILCPLNRESKEQTLLSTKGYLRLGELLVDTDGLPSLLWSQGVGGRPNIYVASLTSTNLDASVLLVDSVHTDTEPIGMWDDMGNLHLAWRMVAHEISYLYYQLFDPHGHPYAPAQRLGQLGPSRLQGSQFHVTSQGVSLYWSGHGLAVGRGIYHTRLSPGGEVLATSLLAPAPPGLTTGQPRVAEAGDRAHLTWVGMSLHETHVYYLSYDGEAPPPQKVTHDHRGSIEPRLWLDDSGQAWLLYHQVTHDQNRGWLIHQAEPALPSPWYVLGYAGDESWQTPIIFLYLQLQTWSASLFAPLGVPVGLLLVALVIFAGLRLGLFPSSKAGKVLRFVFAFTLVWALKQLNNSMIFVSAGAWHQNYQILVFFLAGAITLAFLRLRRMSFDEDMALALGTYLFTVLHYYLSLLPTLTRYVR